jgi:hypothetical protein
MTAFHRGKKFGDMIPITEVADPMRIAEHACSAKRINHGLERILGRPDLAACGRSQAAKNGRPQARLLQ